MLSWINDFCINIYHEIVYGIRKEILIHSETTCHCKHSNRLLFGVHFLAVLQKESPNFQHFLFPAGSWNRAGSGKFTGIKSKNIHAFDIKEKHDFFT